MYYIVGNLPYKEMVPMGILQERYCPQQSTCMQRKDPVPVAHFRWYCSNKIATAQFFYSIQFLSHHLLWTLCLNPPRKKRSPREINKEETWCIVDTSGLNLGFRVELVPDIYEDIQRRQAMITVIFKHCSANVLRITWKRLQITGFLGFDRRLVF